MQVGPSFQVTWCRLWYVFVLARQVNPFPNAMAQTENGEITNKETPSHKNIGPFQSQQALRTLDISQVPGRIAALHDVEKYSLTIGI